MVPWNSPRAQNIAPQAFTAAPMAPPAPLPPPPPLPIGGGAARKGRSEAAAIVAMLVVLLGVAAAAFAGGHKYGPHWGGGSVGGEDPNCYFDHAYYCNY